MNGKTKLVGLLGWPLHYSLSPHFHNHAYKLLDINYTYVPLRINPERKDNLRDALYGLRAMDFVGANVTIPYKQNIIPLLDTQTEASKQARSVNVVIIKDGVIEGDTNDGEAFVSDLKQQEVSHLKDKSIAIIGAGGCAYAITRSLLEEGCKNIVIYNRTVENAERLIASFNARAVAQGVMEDVHRADIVVNCTAPNASFNFTFRNNQIIYDTNYMDDAVVFKKLAESAGSRFISGIGMLKQSAALSFKRFTGIDAKFPL